MSSRLIIGFMMLASSWPAFAFPVMFSAASSSVFAIIITIFGLSSGIKREKNKYELIKSLLILVSFICVFLFFSNMSHNSDYSHYIEHEYHDEKTKPHDDIDKLYLLSMDDAIDKIKSEGLDYIITSGSLTPPVDGFSLVYYNDIEKIKEYASKDQSSFYILSLHRNHAISAAGIIRRSTDKPIYIIDIGNIEFPNKNIETKLIKYDANYKNLSMHYEKYNVISIANTNALKMHIIHNSKLFTEYDLFFLTDTDWNNIRSEFNKNGKPTLVAINAHYGKKRVSDIAAYVGEKLGHQTIFYENLQKFDLFMTTAVNDNEVVPAHHNSTRSFSSSELEAFFRVNNKMSVYCFSINCLRKVPALEDGMSGFLLDTNKFFSVKKGNMSFDTSSFSKGEPIFLAPEDSATLLISYFLAYELSINGYDFRGFIKNSAAMFGDEKRVEKNPTAKDPFTYIKYSEIGFLLNEIYFNVIPYSGINIDAFDLAKLGFFLGLLFIFGRLGRITSGVLTLSISFSFIDLFTFNLSAYEKFVFHPVLLGFIFLCFIYLNSRKEFKRESPLLITGFLLLIFLVATYSFTKITPPIDILYASILLTLIFFKLISILLTKGCEKDNFGHKYLNTVKFVSGNHGYVVGPEYKISILSLLLSRKWIVRSNHLTDEENAGGIYSSTVSSIRNTNKTIKILSAEARKTLADGQIQFWVMPFVDYKKTGVMQSHDYNSPFSFSYSLSKPGQVTEGKNSEYHIVHRKSKKTRLEKKLLKKLAYIERNFGKSVIVEFGVRYGKIDILQVKEHINIHPSEDINVAKSWRENFKIAKEIENFNLSPLSRSIISKLYNYNVVIDNGVAYRAGHSEFDFDILLAKKVMAELIDIHSRIGNYISVCGTYGLVGVLADVIKPVSNTKASDRVLGNNSEVSVTQTSVYKYLAEHKIIPLSMEITSDWYNGEVVLIHSERELCKSLMMMAFSLIKLAYQIEGNDINKNLSLSSMITGREDEDLTVAPQELREWVIVRGELPDRVIHIDDINDVAPSARKEVTLIGEVIPPAIMGVIREFGGVVAENGSPLCHLAITAKHYKIPCRIGIEHYKRAIKDK